MSTFTLEIKLPEALHELGFDDEEIRRELPVLLVLKRFREGAISSGKAAHILGVSRRQFLERLAQDGLPVYDPTDDELAHELKTVRFWAACQLGEGDYTLLRRELFASETVDSLIEKVRAYEQQDG